MNDVSVRPAGLRLDLGCGSRKREGFLGVDERQFGSVDFIADLRKVWPWQDSSVSEVYCSHFLEHLDAMERVHFFNELYRIMAPGCKATIITPHWCHRGAYGDPTHKWPPVSEMTYIYLNREWRAKNAPHTDFYVCHFDFDYSYGISAELSARPEPEQLHAVSHLKEAAQDLIAVLTKR